MIDRSSRIIGLSQFFRQNRKRRNAARPERHRDFYTNYRFNANTRDGGGWRYQRSKT